ncbi:TfuA-like protein [Sphingomonas aerolata]|uniref:TfuA-like protein n=1 Tax=Sphingomonas aerolata TaxID=185951 RepID=UPI002FE16B23
MAALRSLRLFGTRRSLTPLARGVPVLGGASLGAIRAAELAAAGGCEGSVRYLSVMRQAQSAETMR